MFLLNHVNVMTCKQSVLPLSLCMVTGQTGVTFSLLDVCPGLTLWQGDRPDAHRGQSVGSGEGDQTIRVYMQGVR